MRGIGIVLFLAAASAAEDRQTVYVRDIATDEPVRDLAVTVRVDDRVETRTSGARGVLELPTGRTVHIESNDEAWRIRPARFRVDEDRIEIGAHRFRTVRGALTGEGIEHIEDGNVYATFVDPTGRNANVGSGAARLRPFGLRSLWRAGIPDADGTFRVRVPDIPGVALFARHGSRFAPVTRLPKDERARIELRLLDGLPIGGTVVDEQDRPVAGATILVIASLFSRDGDLPEREMRRRIPPGNAMTISLVLNGVRHEVHSREMHAESNDSGAFEVESTTGGHHRILVFATGYRPYDSGTIALDAPRPDLRIRLHRPETPASIPVTCKGRAERLTEIYVTELLPKDERHPYGGRLAHFFVPVDRDGRMPTTWFRDGHTYLLRVIGGAHTSVQIRWPLDGVEIEAGRQTEMEGLIEKDAKVEVK